MTHQDGYPPWVSAAAVRRGPLTVRLQAAELKLPMNFISSKISLQKMSKKIPQDHSCGSSYVNSNPSGSGRKHATAVTVCKNGCKDDRAILSRPIDDDCISGPFHFQPSFQSFFQCIPLFRHLQDVLP
jgi:hypothetical protein